MRATLLYYSSIDRSRSHGYDGIPVVLADVVVAPQVVLAGTLNRLQQSSRPRMPRVDLGVAPEIHDYVDTVQGHLWEVSR